MSFYSFSHPSLRRFPVGGGARNCVVGDFVADRSSFVLNVTDGRFLATFYFQGGNAGSCGQANDGTCSNDGREDERGLTEALFSQIPPLLSP